MKMEIEFILLNMLILKDNQHNLLIQQDFHQMINILKKE